jgi:hypothetical protein
MDRIDILEKKHESTKRTLSFIGKVNFPWVAQFIRWFEGMEQRKRGWKFFFD